MDLATELSLSLTKEANQQAVTELNKVIDRVRQLNQSVEQIINVVERDVVSSLGIERKQSGSNEGIH